jgi:integrase
MAQSWHDSRRFGSVRRLSSGRFQARYTFEAVEHKAPRTFADEEAANKWLRIKQTELDPGALLLARPKRAGATFGDYAQRWLAERDLKPRTRVLYGRQLQLYLLPTFGKRSLNSITAASVREWHANFGSGSPTSRAHAYSLLKAILTSATQDDLIDANPCRIRGASSVTRRRTVKPATLEELALMVEVMPEPLRPLVLISAWAALRFGEATELRRRDVDGNVLHITRAVVRLPGQHLVGTPKSQAGVRSVTMPPHIVLVVSQHLAAMKNKSPDALLFPADHGGNLATSTLNRHWHRAREAAGRPDLRWHDLRHTGAVLAAQTGATLAELMARLGHSTPGAALRYQHAAQGRDAVIAEALSVLAERNAR